MQKSRPLIFLALAVVLALVTSVLAYNWLAAQPRVGTVEAIHTELVAVAVSNLYWGTKLTEEMIKLVPFPNGSLPQGHFSTLETVTGRVLLVNMTTNEPILESKLAPLTVTTGGVAAITNPEKRAMAVKVDEVIGVAGFINPGNRVDVLVTFNLPGTESGSQSDPVTKIVLQNMLVLATGTEVERRGKEEKPSLVKVITLEVTPEEGEKLALAANQGNIRLALRNYVNSAPVLTRGATIPALLSSYRLGEEMKTVNRAAAKPAEHTAAPVKPKPPVKVELIKGGAVSVLDF
jgi:pilus assembly protein CpaB